MKVHIKVKIWFVVCCVCVVPAVKVWAQFENGQEWVDIPVAANLINTNDTNDVEAIVKEANATLQQARIRLIVLKTNANVSVGNGDGNLTEAEGLQAVEDGREELEQIFGAGKGIKVNIAEDVWVEQPDSAGWGILLTPVVFIESSASPTEMGQELARQVARVLTLDLTGNDPDPDAFQEAKRRGMPYYVDAREMPKEPEVCPPGRRQSFDIHASVSDPRGDISSTGDLIQYPSVDLRNFRMWQDNPSSASEPFHISWTRDEPTDDEWSVDMVLEVNGFFRSGVSVLGIGPDVQDVQVTDYRTLENQALPTNTFRIRANDIFSIPGSFTYQTIEGSVPPELLVPEGVLSIIPYNDVTVRGGSFASVFHEGHVLVLTDGTDPAPLKLTGLCPPGGRDLNILTNGISGWGWTPDTRLEISIDDIQVGSRRVNADGKFFYRLAASFYENEPFSHTGVHSILAREIDDSGPNGAGYASGFFLGPQNVPGE